MRLGGNCGSGLKYSSCALKATAIMSGPSPMSLTFSSIRALATPNCMTGLLLDRIASFSRFQPS